jgi:hypothetical protein
MLPTVVGQFTGLLLGLAWVLGGFDAFVGTAVLGVLENLLGKVGDGQLDLTQYLGGRRSARRPRARTSPRPPLPRRRWAPRTTPVTAGP